MTALFLLLFGFNTPDLQTYDSPVQDMETVTLAAEDTTVLKVKMESFILIGWGTCFHLKYVETIHGETPEFKFSKDAFRVYIGGSERYEGELTFLDLENPNPVLTMKLFKTEEKVADDYDYDHRPDYQNGLVDKEGNVWELVE